MDFRFEVPFECSYGTESGLPWFTVDFKVCHPRAFVEEIRGKQGWDDSRQEAGVLIVRDRGSVSAQSICRTVIVCYERPGGYQPLPDLAGAFLGSFLTQRQRWLVFSPRASAPSRQSKPVAPSPRKERQSPEVLLRGPACASQESSAPADTGCPWLPPTGNPGSDTKP
jgi:hypothetical protein